MNRALSVERVTSDRSARVLKLIVLPAVILMLACGTDAGSGASVNAADPSASSGSAAASSSAQSSAAEHDLPVEVIWVDLAGPATLGQAVASSEDVVIANVEESIPGVRFVGSDPAEDLAGPLYEEVVGLRLRVEQTLKGTRNSGDEFTLNWPTYLTSRRESSSRTAVMEIEGLERELSTGTSYLFMVRDFGEPWGMSQISPAYAVAEIDNEGLLDGRMSSGFEVMRGRPVSDLPGVDLLPAGSD